MKLSKTLTLLALLSALTACAASTATVEPPNLGPALNADLARPCPKPVTLPERDLLQAEAEEYWDKDRAALRDCGKRLGIVTTYYKDRDGALAKR